MTKDAQLQEVRYGQNWPGWLKQQDMAGRRK